MGYVFVKIRLFPLIWRLKTNKKLLPSKITHTIFVGKELCAVKYAVFGIILYRIIAIFL